MVISDSSLFILLVSLYEKTHLFVYISILYNITSYFIYIGEYCPSFAISTDPRDNITQYKCNNA